MIKRKNTERKRGKSDTRTKSRELTVQPPVTIAFGIALEHWFWEWSFDEVHNVHLTNWSSQRSFINYSSSLVAVHSVNRAAFKTKLSIVDSVARRSVVRCTLGIPTNDLHIFFSPVIPLFVYIRVWHPYCHVMIVHRARPDFSSTFGRANNNCIDVIENSMPVFYNCFGLWCTRHARAFCRV